MYLNCHWERLSQLARCDWILATNLDAALPWSQFFFVRTATMITVFCEGSYHGLGVFLWGLLPWSQCFFEGCYHGTVFCEGCYHGRIVFFVRTVTMVAVFLWELLPWSQYFCEGCYNGRSVFCEAATIVTVFFCEDFFHLMLALLYLSITALVESMRVEIRVQREISLPFSLQYFSISWSKERVKRHAFSWAVQTS